MGGEQNYLAQVAADAVAPELTKKEKYSDAYFLRPSVVYFIAAGDNPIKAAKIGITARNTISARIKSIQSANHERIKLLKVLEYLEGAKPGLAAENRDQELHKTFANLQRAKPFTVGHEWFSYEGLLVEFVESITSLPKDLQALT